MTGVIQQLRDRGWTWTRIGAHYGVSEREVRRWAVEGTPERLTGHPACLSYGTAFIVSDTQYPFYDKALWEVVCDVADDLDIDTLIWDGDILDFPQLSTKFSHNAYTLKTVKQDIHGFHRDLRDPLIKAARPTEEVFSAGNHEQRYERYLLDIATALEDAARPFPEFAELPKEVRYHPYGRAIGEWLTPGLLVSHGWRASQHAAYTAKANLDDLGGSVSVITGHTHRVGSHFRMTPTGLVKSYEVGHMCDPTYLPKAVPGLDNWAQVAGTVVRWHRATGEFHVEIAEVLGNGEVVVGDRVYRLDR